MVEPLLEDFREHVAESGKHIDHAKEVLQDACDSAFDESKRKLKRGRRIVLHLTTNAQHAARKHVLPSMTGAFVIGIAAGILVGWFLTRRD
jgi:ElaB/YqjD/DUF883 family membrane-anchored ribosome-binding protein